MKKLLTILLVTTMLLSITSCDETETTGDTITYQTKDTATTSQTTTATETSAIIETTTDTTESSSTTSESSETTPAQTEDYWHKTELYKRGWKYKEIDLSTCQYKSTVIFDHKSDFIAESAKKLGYSENTYEYDYFRALLGISYYTALAEFRVTIGGEVRSDKEVAVNTFFEEYADPMVFQEPYDDILYESFRLLKDRDFCLHEMSLQDFSYGHTGRITYWADYRYNIKEWDGKLALLFSDIDTKLIEYTELLLSLSQKYSKYQGEFVLSETAKQVAENLLEACKPVSERREDMFKVWGEYYLSIKPEYTVEYDLIPEMGTIQLTLTSENNSFLFEREYYGWIKDFNGEINVGGNPHVTSIHGPNDSPVILYFPIRKCYAWNGKLEGAVYDENGDSHDFKYQLSLNFDDFEDMECEDVVMRDPFLEAALKKEFGGEYTYVDLCKIKYLTFNYHLKVPTIQIVFYDQKYGQNAGESTYVYSDFFEEAYEKKYPEELKSDIKQFPCLSNFFVYGKGVNLQTDFISLEEREALFADHIADDFEAYE